MIGIRVPARFVNHNFQGSNLIPHRSGFPETLAGAHNPAMSRWRTCVTFAVWSMALFAASPAADAQFKELGPPPLTPAAARQKFKTLLETVDAGNRQQTVATISGLLPWYRDIFDEELIAAWQKDGRANLPELIKPLASSRAASGIIEFSWRQQREATFLPVYAPMFGDLMARYAESARPFLEDLLGIAPDLSPQVASAVSRILLDMPDLGTWRKDALHILPNYRSVAESLLVQDLRGGDEEKRYRARVWLTDLKSNPSILASERNSPTNDRSSPANDRRRTRGVSPIPPVLDSPPAANPPTSATPPPVLTRAPASVAQPPTASPAPASVPPPAPTPLPAPPAAPMAAPLYDGAKSGTLTCTGGPVPQNAEYVFRDLPLVKMRLDYDTRIWDAHLSPAIGQTQKLILRNKSSSPQKRCEVRWSVIP